KSQCRRCCDRWPWPSVITQIAFCIAISTFCACLHLAAEDTINIFQDTAARYTIENTLYWGKISVYCVTALTIAVAFTFMAVGCLATGSVTIISYTLLICWIAVTMVAVIPFIFFYIIKENHCGDPGRCIDLRQYGFANITEPNQDVYLFCDRNLYCSQNPYELYLYGLIAASVVLVMVSNFLMILSANWAHVKHRYRSPAASRYPKCNRSTDTLRLSRDLSSSYGHHNELSIISNNSTLNTDTIHTTQNYTNAYHI
uniref:Proteolipid protein DM beta-like n=1 Tax=Saccoglossus kowalevskii TaxID=10224 RepID=A0ABM0N0Y5_SACKO